MIMAPLNSSVKMSPYEEGDSFIESEGTATVMILNQVERGKLTGEQAAVLVGLSLRQIWRLLAAYRKGGVAALAHGNRGQRPVHAFPEEIRKRVVMLAQGIYAGCNHYHLTELLAEREGLVLSRSSVWRILTAVGIPSPRRLPQAQIIPGENPELLG